MSKQNWGLVLAGAAFSLSILAYISSSNFARAAYSAQFGRGEFNGYFTDINDCWGDKVFTSIATDMQISPGNAVDNASEFISYIENKLGGSGSEKTGAQFIIHTMLGHSAGVAKAVSAADLAEWKDRVNYYASQNWINWSQSVTYSVNSFYQGTSGAGLSCNPNPDDDAWYGDDGTKASIVFSGGGATYIIKRDCGNPLGGSGGLAERPKNYDHDVTLQATSTLPGTTIKPGDTLSFIAGMKNNGPAAGPGTGLDAFDINDPTASYIEYVPGNNCGGDIYCDSTGLGYGPIAMDGSTRWHFAWHRSSMPPYPQAYFEYGYGFQLRVKANAPDGANMCVQAAVSPAAGVNGGAITDNEDHTDPSVFCYPIENPRYPYIDTAGGDVHAGGGIGLGINCGSTGSINSRAGVSRSDYIVSAGGNINNFGSAGSPTETKLIFGNDPATSLGSYGRICRPDLPAAAEKYSPKVTSPATSYTVGQTSSGEGRDTLVKITPALGVTLALSGVNPVPFRETIYVVGNVRITSNIITNRTTRFARGDLPTFGLIATGNILIDPGVTQLDGYYWAGGVIDTCRNATGGPNIALNQARDCANPLNVNGFMMAGSFNFRRTGPANTIGLQRAEFVQLIGALYFAPPPAYSDVVSARATTPHYEGDRPPLY